MVHALFDRHFIHRHPCWASPLDRAREAATLNAAQDAQCRAYGTTMGSEAYTACRLKLAEIEQQRTRDRAAAIGAALQESANSQQRNYEQQLQAIEAARQAREGRRPIQCTSQDNGFGTVNTRCN
jgi:hypothetical protein